MNQGVSEPASQSSRCFLFVGNGPYRNRGCEAIVRGTMEILSDAWGPDITVRAGVMAAPETVAAQQASEIDPRVKNFSISQVGRRLSPKWWMAQANARLGAGFNHHTLDLNGRYETARVALQLGGDNYSLDYGGVLDYVAVDRFLQERGVPVFIWGGSVGPFEKEPAVARKVHAHLKMLDGIFVRETETQAYLARYGVVDNVHLVADPAFAMRKSEPAVEIQALVSEETIGLNISPLVARFAGASSVDEWRELAAQMISTCANRTQRPILLIPHAASPKPDEDDYLFMNSLLPKVSDGTNVPVGIAPPLSAAELKWIIANCAAFAGARTHSTIAALSSRVPTLSLSYSIKAIGINQDIFGHLNFCQAVKTITPELFADAMCRLIDDNASIRNYLEATIPAFQSKAELAGRILFERLSGW